MTSGKWILALTIATSAWAQGPAVVPLPAQIAAKLAAAQPKQGALPASIDAAPAGATNGTAQPRQPKQAARKPMAGAAPKAPTVKPVANSKQPAQAATENSGPAAKRGRRDPFVSPIVERASFGPPCTGTGKRCLYVGDLSLVGIVQSADGVIAVVLSGNRTYFLREHDPLADGVVEKITGDAITMRQRSSDLFGRPQMREVIRKLGGPAV
jgi:hypothetical protein